MRQVARAVLALVLFLGLFAAGAAAGGLDLKSVILRPGQCITLARVHVCAAKARPAKTRIITVTDAVTSTVAGPPVTVAGPPVTVTNTVTAPPVTVTVTTTPTPQTAFLDGTYRVGTDIVAGTYKSTATTDSCYWERLSGFGGTLGEIIANYYGSGPTYVTIAPTDLGFHSARCGGWSKV
ncbi:MAG: hypothetical protein WBB76_04865 [Gaiellaceae bacterium]